ncbi:MAG: response regulator receiver protein [Acidimicrobiaceae bacterium]|nr:response regulator receiver protein [Acidimicrobiaceae bacterium]
MTMFEYDSRPVTPQVVLIGTRASPVAYAVRDFLTRNGRPYEWIDVDDVRARSIIAEVGDDRSLLPICVLPDGARLAPASVEQVAFGLGMLAPPLQSAYDLAIVGAGPAGLAAAVYGSSEGLATIAVEAVAPGGQAGTTSMIENYLGFPTGVSGNELATRAVLQARRFGTEILVARHLARASYEGHDLKLELSDSCEFTARAVLLATGVEWRRLNVEGIDDLLGTNIFYGAGPSEAASCGNARVAIVGGGNSAGQAAVRFSKYAARVTLLVRAESLAASMSQYLLDRITHTENIDVRTCTEIVGLEGDGQLRRLVLSRTGTRDLERLDTDALFICIGGTPRSADAVGVGAITDAGGYVVTGYELVEGNVPPKGWTLQRPPLPLETNLPGIFAAGDVRHGSIKRCAAAIGEGAMAVAFVHRRLEELDGG